MKLPFTALVSLLFFSTFMLYCGKSYASHAMGGQITYECLGGNVYVVTLAFYRDCAGISAPSSMPIVVSSSCGNFNLNVTQTSSQEVSAICDSSTSTCQGGALPGVVEYIYQDTLTLVPCIDWQFTWTHCCRNAGITNLANPSSEEIYTITSLDNTSGCNSSPVFGSSMVPYICDSTLTSLNFGATDADGDSLVYSLVNALSAGGALIPYAPGYSAFYPIFTQSGFVYLDPATGLMTFIPNGSQICVVSILIEEYSNGVLVGSTIIDIQIIVLSCTGNNSPGLDSAGIINLFGGNLLDSNSVEICVGDSISFDIVFSDLDSIDTLSLASNITSNLSGAVLTLSGINPLTASITWIPGFLNIGSSSWIMTIEDNNCPVVSSQSYMFDIEVLSGVYAGPDVYLCNGDTAQLSSNVGSNIQWSPALGLSSDTISNPLAYPDTTTTYILTSTFSGNCDTIDTITVYVVPNFSLNVGPDQTICSGGSAQLSVSASPPGTYIYNWSPSSDLSNDTIADPLASPVSATNYSVSVTSLAQCTKTGSVFIDVDTAVIGIDPTSNAGILCPGDSIILNANVTISNCDTYNQASILYSPLSGIGTNVTLADDAVSTALPIGFNFQFYCNTYSQFYISSNGFLTFNSVSGNGCCSGQVLPNAAQPNDLIAFAWVDLNPALGGTIDYFTTGSTPNRKLVMNFDSIQHFSGGDAIVMQVILYETTNVIEIHSTIMPSNGGNHTQGIENSDGTVGQAVPGRNSSDWSVVNEAVRFLPTSSIPYTLTWTDENNDTVGTDTTVILIAGQTTTYTLTMNSGTCSDVQTVDVDLSYIDLADTLLMCLGDTVRLEALAGPAGTILPNSCGASSGCLSPSTIGSYTVGNGTSVNNSTTYPAPYGNWFKNAKHQFLYSAADLLAAGLTPGTFTDIGFFVNAIAGTTLYQAYTIKVGCTSIINLATWQSGLTTVFTPKDITISVGLNNHSLDFPYDWDGLSNLIVEICYDNLSSAYTSNSASPYTTTGYTSAIYYRSDGTVACTYTASQTMSNNRPNTSFTVCNRSLPVSYSWNPATYLNSDTVLAPFANPDTDITYIITFDNGFCTLQDSVRISMVPPFSILLSKVDASCGSADGIAIANIVGGAPPYSYLWSDSTMQTTDSAVGLAVGIYSVEVLDAVGCSNNATVTINSTGGPVLTGFVTNVTCNGLSDGEASVNATGGTAPYTYLWDDPLNQTTAVATGLIAGDYVVLVSGNDTCISNLLFTITELAPILLITSGTDMSCFGICDGDAVVAASGGTPPYAFIWDDSLSQTTSAIGGLCAGNYTVILSDSNSCPDSATVTILEPAEIITTISDSLHNNCFGQCNGFATVSMVSGGIPPFSYLWDDPSTQTMNKASLLCAGNYIGTVTDSTGCFAASSFTINEPTEIIDVYFSVDANCGQSDGMAGTSVSGGVGPYTYLWSDSLAQTTDTAFSLFFGSYIVNIWDANGCLLVDTINIGNIGAFTLSATSITNVDCYGTSTGSATVSPNGGLAPYTYLWNDGNSQTNATAVGLSAGNYSVNAIDSGGCYASLSVQITETLQLASNLAANQPNCVCNGSISSSVQGGTPPYTYSWNDSGNQTNSTATGLCAGSYTVQILDSNNCSIQISEILNAPGSYSVSVSGVDANCQNPDGQATASVIGGQAPYSYLWNDSLNQTTATASNLFAGTYIIIVTDSVGCTTTASVTILNLNNTSVTLTSTPGPCAGCNGQAAVIMSGGTPPYTYSWDDPATQTNGTAINLCDGIFTATVTDVQGCTASGAIGIMGPPALVVTVSNIDSASQGLANGAATVSVTGGTLPYTYLWSDAQTTATATALPADNYTCTVTDANGCITIVNVTVPESISPGVFEYEGLSRFDIYPNPTEGKVVFDIELKKTGAIQLQILNVLGEVIYSKSISQVSKVRYETDLSELTNGVYFIQLKSESVNATKRIVVTK